MRPRPPAISTRTRVFDMIVLAVVCVGVALYLVLQPAAETKPRTARAYVGTPTPAPTLAPLERTALYERMILPGPTPRPTLATFPRPCLAEPPTLFFQRHLPRCLVSLSTVAGGEDRVYMLIDGTSVQVWIRTSAEARPAFVDRSLDSYVLPGAVIGNIIHEGGKRYHTATMIIDGLWIDARSAAPNLPFQMGASDLLIGLIPAHPRPLPDPYWDIAVIP